MEMRTGVVSGIEGPVPSTLLAYLGQHREQRVGGQRIERFDKGSLLRDEGAAIGCLGPDDVEVDRDFATAASEMTVFDDTVLVDIPPVDQRARFRAAFEDRGESGRDEGIVRNLGAAADERIRNVAGILTKLEFGVGSTHLHSFAPLAARVFVCRANAFWLLFHSLRPLFFVCSGDETEIEW